MFRVLVQAGAPSQALLSAALAERLAAFALAPGAEEQIIKDVRRTHTAFRHFDDREGGAGHAGLLGLLCCLSADPRTGYVQGLNYIAAGLLFHCEAEWALFAADRLFEAVEAQRLYAGQLEGVMSTVDCFFGDFLRERSPEAHRNLADKDIPPAALFAEWCITLGTSVVPLKHHARLVGGVLAGGWQYLFRVLADAVAALYPAFRDAGAPETLVALKGLGRARRRLRWGDIL